MPYEKYKPLVLREFYQASSGIEGFYVFPETRGDTLPITRRGFDG